MNYFNKKGQAMTEYVLVLMLCVITAWVGTNFFQRRLKNVYSGASRTRAGVQGMYP
ncbi:MAG: hypothetical protein HY919_00770 [Elusimicrobia bacterium]|nr:hypothetical protein [Elusimicrobiota bacterium]